MTATYDPDLIDRLVREAREEPVCQCNGTFSRVHNSTRGCNLHSSFGRETQARLDRQRLAALADQLEAARSEVERHKAFAKEVGCALGVEDEPLADIEREAWGRAGTIVGLRTELESSRATIAKLQHVATGIEQQRHDNAKHKIQMQMVVEAAEAWRADNNWPNFHVLIAAIDAYRAAKGKL